MVKRKGNFYLKICHIDNVELADDKARKNKGFRRVIEKHDLQRLIDNVKLVYDLWYNVYHTSEYTTFKIFEPKEREIYRLPYYPDRICHHAIMNVLEPFWKKLLIRNTYSSIKGRGIHACAKDVRLVLQKYPNETTYCLKLDIRKFYPSINNETLIQILRRKIKDEPLMITLEEIIHSAEGVPIGNYLSLYFANLYLTPFDHWIKLYCKFYFRYADDIVIFSNSKEFLHNILIAIKFYLHLNLDLELKPNYQIFPVDKRGIDFVGYVFKHSHIILRKSIKENIKECVTLYISGKIDAKTFDKSMSSYSGWMKFCNSKYLLKIIEEETGFSYSNWHGMKKPFSFMINKSIVVYGLNIRNKYTRLYYTYKNKSYYTDISNSSLNFKYEKYTKEWK